MLCYQITFWLPLMCPFITVFLLGDYASNATLRRLVRRFHARLHSRVLPSEFFCQRHLGRFHLRLGFLVCPFCFILRPKPSLSFLPPSPGLSHEGGLRRIRRQHLSTQPSFRYHDVKKQRNTHTKLSLSTSEYFMTSTRLQQISIAKNSVYEMNRLPVEKEPPVLNGLKMKCFPLGLTGHIVKDKPRQFLCFFN